jgi:ribonucleoside-diphosphate reductase alpha chain
VVQERLLEALPKPKSFTAPRSGHLHPIGEPNGHGNGQANGAKTAVSTQTDKVRLARLKGYEGDPCPECGQLTLVRSGACAKCDTCGATSGCS